MQQRLMEKNPYDNSGKSPAHRLRSMVSRRSCNITRFSADYKNIAEIQLVLCSDEERQPYLHSRMETAVVPIEELLMEKTIQGGGLESVVMGCLMGL